MAATDIDVALARAKSGVQCKTGGRTSLKYDHTCEVFAIKLDPVSGGVLIRATETVLKDRGVNIELRLAPAAITSILEALMSGLKVKS